MSTFKINENCIRRWRTNWGWIHVSTTILWAAGHTNADCKGRLLLHPTLPEWKIVFALSIWLLLPPVVMKTCSTWNENCVPALRLSVVTLVCQLVAAVAAPKIGELPYEYRTSASRRDLRRLDEVRSAGYRQTLHLLHLQQDPEPPEARGQRKHGGTAPTGGQGAAYLPRSTYTYCLRAYVCVYVRMQ